MAQANTAATTPTPAQSTAPVAKNEESTKRCDVSKIQVGSMFSRHSFGTVIGIRGDMVQLRNAKGYEWEIGKNIVAQEFSFADQFDNEESVSRTRAIEVLTEHSHTAMTVHFNKAPDPKAVAEALKVGQGRMSDREWNKLVATQVAGEERTMIGYHTNHFDMHRRLEFHETGVGLRLVDPRTINWLIVGRTKYTVK